MRLGRVLLAGALELDHPLVIGRGLGQRALQAAAEQPQLPILVIVDPITLPPNANIATARRIMREYNVSGIPIVLTGVASEAEARAASDPAPVAVAADLHSLVVGS